MPITGELTFPDVPGKINEHNQSPNAHSVRIDNTVSQPGMAADAKATRDLVGNVSGQIEEEVDDLNDEVADLKSSMGNKSSLNTDTKTNLVSAINEVNGHFLDGIEAGVADWLDDHPEATTTVQDGAVSEQKLSQSVQSKIADPYFPVEVGSLTYSKSGNSTDIDYVIIDKSYKPRLVLAGDSFKDGDTLVVADVSAVSMREGATVACNAGCYHNVNQSGTIIVDGIVKHENDLSYLEWENYDLENLYMTDDGVLHIVDAFTSASSMMEQNPVWSFNGWNAIYKDGEAVDTFYNRVYTPKTVIAQDYDGNYMVLTSGGRRPDNYGLVYADIIDAIINKIGFDARLIYNCDGGGSSSLVVNQIRLNDITTQGARPIPTILTFTRPNIVVTDHSEYEVGNIIYNVNNKARSKKNFIYSNTFDIVTPNPTVPGFRIFSASSDEYDQYTYNQVFKLGYSMEDNSIRLDALRSDDRYLNALGIIDSTDTAQILGKEVFRASEIKVIEGTYTTNSVGNIDSNAIVTGGLTNSSTHILSITPITSSTVIMIATYGSRYIFPVKTESTLEPKVNTDVTMRILYVVSPSFVVSS